MIDDGKILVNQKQVKAGYALKLNDEVIDFELTANRGDLLSMLGMAYEVGAIYGKEVKPLETFSIPSNITKLGDYCFANCKYLTEIKGLENIQEYGKGSFFNCPKMVDKG